MKKRDLCKLVAERTGFRQTESLYVVDKIFEGIGDILKRSGRLELRGFGTFVVKKRKERVGRIIATGEIVKIPERKTVVFVPGKALKRV